ncbi:MAG: branched-chain amino acid ABC transporter permease [Pseudomonadota bacterium]
MPQLTLYLKRVWPLLSLILIVVGVVLVCLPLPESGQRFVVLMLVNLVLVVSLYIFVGNSGVLSFGHTSFVTIGAYTSGLFTMTAVRKAVLIPGASELLVQIQLPWFQALLAGAVLAMLFAAVTGIPLMRLSGLAASISTLSLLIIVNVVASYWETVTSGKSSLPVPMYTGIGNALILALITMTVAFIYQNTRSGLRLRASREDEEAAKSVGVNITRERWIAFTLSAFFTAIGGALYGHYLGNLFPDSFYLATAFFPIAMLVVGGINSLSGAVIGTVLLSVVGEVMRVMEGGLEIGPLVIHAPSGLREVGWAVIMLLVLIFRPRGLTNNKEITWPWGPLVQRPKAQPGETHLMSYKKETQ